MPINYDTLTDSYIGTHNFQVAITGVTDINAEFVTISGVVSTTEEIEFMHGNDPMVRKTGGRLAYEPIVMERVYKGVDDFYRWRLEIENGNIERKDVSIRMMNAGFAVVRQMTLQGAWPIKWEMPDMDATSSRPAMERITLSVDRVRESAP